MFNETVKAPNLRTMMMVAKKAKEVHTIPKNSNQ
jgi:hypothetical protein